MTIPTRPITPLDPNGVEGARAATALTEVLGQIRAEIEEPKAAAQALQRGGRAA